MDWISTLGGGAAVGFLLVIVWLIIHRDH